MGNYDLLRDAGFSPAAVAVIENPERIFDLSTAQRREVEREIDEVWNGVLFND